MSNTHAYQTQNQADSFPQIRILPALPLLVHVTQVLKVLYFFTICVLVPVNWQHPQGQTLLVFQIWGSCPWSAGTQPQPGPYQAGKQGLTFQPLPAWPLQRCRPVPSLSLPKASLCLRLFVSACFIVYVPLPLDLFLSRLLALSNSSSDSASMTLYLSLIYFYTCLWRLRVFFVCRCLSAFASSPTRCS